MDSPDEPLIYRDEVLAIMALADLVVELRRVRELMEGEDGEAEEE